MENRGNCPPRRYSQQIVEKSKGKQISKFPMLAKKKTQRNKRLKLGRIDPNLFPTSPVPHLAIASQALH